MKFKKYIGETDLYDKKEKLEHRKPKSWCKSVSAFANGEGGILIFGIGNDDKVIGLDNAEKDSETISEQIKLYIDPIPKFSFRFEELENKRKVLFVRVFPGIDPPYYYSKDGSTEAFQRVGNQSIPVDRFELRNLVMKGTNNSFDSLSTKYSFNDYAFSKLRATYKQSNGESFDDSYFESFGIVDADGFLTNAGALLADNSPIRHSRLFCTRWNGLDKADGVMDALDDKEYSDGLIQLLEYGINFIKINSKTKWKKTSNSRIELPDYGERAVFEAMVNALIHRDYLEYGSEIHIDIFDNRLVIYSPGGMYDGTKIQEVDPLTVSSKRRNPIIADIFNRLKLMERRGSGFKKIFQDYENQKLYSQDKKPLFYTLNNSFYVELKNLNYLNKDVNSVETPFNDTLEKLDETNNKIIELLIEKPTIKQRDIANKIGLSVSSINNRLSNLEKKNIIRKEGSTQNMKYVVLIDHTNR